MKFKNNIKVFGDTSFRGKCPTESAEQMTFFNKLRREYPDTLGLIALHPRNEGSRTIQQTDRHKAEGMTNGASDIIIPGSPAFVCELKRLDHTKCTWQKGQVEFLIASANNGAFACVAFGWESAWEALQQWRLSLSN
jgi:hypothetical protein